MVFVEMNTVSVDFLDRKRKFAFDFCLVSCHHNPIIHSTLKHRKQQKSIQTNVNNNEPEKTQGVGERRNLGGGNRCSFDSARRNPKKLAEAQELVRSLQDKFSTTDAENKSLKADNKSLEGKLSKIEALVKTLQEKDQPIDENNDGDDDSVLDPSNPWAVKFKELREYRAINGDCKVPMKYTLNPQLGTWVNNKKLKYANTKMGRNRKIISQNKIDKLDSIGMYWGKKFPHVSWEQSFDELMKYRGPRSV
jgi:hypothetical protein